MFSVNFNRIGFSLCAAASKSSNHFGESVLLNSFLLLINRSLRSSESSKRAGSEERLIRESDWHQCLRKQLHRWWCVSVLCFQLSGARTCVRVSVCVSVCVCFTDGVEQCGVRSLSRRSGIRSHQIHQTASNYHTSPQLGEWHVSALTHCDQ